MDRPTCSRLLHSSPSSARASKIGARAPTSSVISCAPALEAPTATSSVNTVTSTVVRIQFMIILQERGWGGSVLEAERTANPYNLYASGVGARTGSVEA